MKNKIYKKVIKSTNNDINLIENIIAQLKDIIFKKGAINNCNHSRSPVFNIDNNCIGEYCTECDIFYNSKGEAIKC